MCLKFSSGCILHEVQRIAFFCALTALIVWKQFRGTACAQTGLLGKKGARNCLQRAFNRVSVGEEARLPPHLGGVCICGNHSLNSRWHLENSTGSGQEGACSEKDAAEAICRMSSLYSDYIFGVGTISLLHAAALSLVAPGCQIVESYLWRSRAERIHHYSFTGLFPITHLHLFFWVFLSVFVSGAISGLASKKW